MDLALAGPGGLRLWAREEEGDGFTEATPAPAGPAGADPAVAAPAAATLDAWGVWAADTEMDGDLDIVLAAAAGAPAVLRNNADGTWRREDPFPGVTVLRGFGWGDFDLDGDPDAVLLDGSGVLHLFENRQAGRFDPAGPLALPAAAVGLAVGDLDADGRLDLALLDADGGLWRGSWDGAAWATAEIASWDGFPAGAAPGSHRLLLADLDNNGALDVLASGASGTRMWLADEGSRLEPLEAGVEAEIFAAYDLTGDGLLDLVGVEDGTPVRLTAQADAGYGWQQIRPRAHVAAGDQRINAFGVGGEIEVRAGLLVQKQVLTGAPAHFGLGVQTQADVTPHQLAQRRDPGRLRVRGQPGHRGRAAAQGLVPVALRPRRHPHELRHRLHLALAPRPAHQRPGHRGHRVHRGPGARPGRSTRRGGRRVRPAHHRRPVGDALLRPRVAAGGGPSVRHRGVGGRALRPRPGVARDRRDRPVPHRDPGLGRRRRRRERARLEAGQPLRGLVRRGHPPGDRRAALPRAGARRGDGGVGRGDPARPRLGLSHRQQHQRRPRAGQAPHPPWGGHGGAGRQGRLGGSARRPRVPGRQAQDDGRRTCRASPTARGRGGCACGPTSRSTGTGSPWPRGSTPVWRGRRASTRRWPTSATAVYSRTELLGPRGLELPDYEIGNHRPRWRDLVGFHTRFGDVRELLAGVDDRYVIKNAGDEMRLRFEAPPPPEAGWRRDYVLIGDGWVKDGDFNTTHAKTVGPLPSHDQPVYDPDVSAVLEDDPVYQRHPDDWLNWHTRYVAPDYFLRRPAARRPGTGAGGGSEAVIFGEAPRHSTTRRNRPARRRRHRRRHPWAEAAMRVQTRGSRRFSTVNLALVFGCALTAANVSAQLPGLPPVPLPDEPRIFATAEEPQVRVTVLARGLEHPWGLAFLPDGGLLVTERPGRLRIVRDGVVDPEPLTGVPEVYSQGLAGLMDVALHPEFTENGLVYLTYSKPAGEGARVTLARGAVDGARAGRRRRSLPVGHGRRHCRFARGLRARRQPVHDRGRGVRRGHRRPAGAGPRRHRRQGGSPAGRRARPRRQPVRGPRRLPAGDLLPRPPEPARGRR